MSRAGPNTLLNPVQGAAVATDSVHRAEIVLFRPIKLGDESGWSPNGWPAASPRRRGRTFAGLRGRAIDGGRCDTLRRINGRIDIGALRESIIAICPGMAGSPLTPLTPAAGKTGPIRSTDPVERKLGKR